MRDQEVIPRLHPARPVLMIILLFYLVANLLILATCLLMMNQGFCTLGCQSAFYDLTAMGVFAWPIGWGIGWIGGLWQEIARICQLTLPGWIKTTYPLCQSLFLLVIPISFVLSFAMHSLVMKSPGP